MDGNRFDALTRTMAQGTTRRRALHAALGGLAGSVLALTGRAAADAATCQPAGGICLPNSRCCDGTCDPRTHRCVCPAGLIASGGRCCIGNRSDTVCTANAQCCSGICQQGTCYPTAGGSCPDGANSCSGHVELCGPAGTMCWCFQTLAGEPLCGVPQFTADDCAGCGDLICAQGGNGGICRRAVECAAPCPPVV